MDIQRLRLEYRDAEELAENPSNWRCHPQNQIDSLQAVIEEVGWAGALLYNERTKRLIDGHARKKIATGKVPVLIGEWSEEQENLILATLDPLAAMATTNQEALDALLGDIETNKAALNKMLEKMASKGAEGDDFVPPDKFEVIVECENEAQQKQVFDQMTQEGFECRVLTF